MTSNDSLKSGFFFRYIRIFQLYIFSVTSVRWLDYGCFLIKVLFLWVGIWGLTSFLTQQAPIFISLLSTFTIVRIDIFFALFLDNLIQTLQSCDFIHLMLQGEGGGAFGILNIISYTTGSIISGYIFISMLRPKRVITFSKKVALTTRSSGRYLVFRFATSGSELYDLRAELDFSPKDARENPLNPDKDHIVFKLPNNEGSYSELIGVHELYFPLDSDSRNDSKYDGSKHNEECRGIPSSVFPNSGNQPSAILRIIAHTANGHPVNASKEFNLSKDANEETVVRGVFAKTLQDYNWGCFKGEKLYDFRNFNSIE